MNYFFSIKKLPSEYFYDIIYYMICIFSVYRNRTCHYKNFIKNCYFCRKYASKSKFLWSKIQKLQNILLKNKLRNYLMQSNVSSEELAKRSPETKKLGLI